MAHRDIAPSFPPLPTPCRNPLEPDGQGLGQEQASLQGLLEQA